MSTKNKKPPVPDDKNHTFAKDGFTYRTVYFQDFDGSYYKISLSIGEDNGVSTVYNVGKIKTEDIPDGKILSTIGSKADMSSVQHSISNSSENVNSQYMFAGPNADADVRYSLSIIETKEQFDKLLAEKYEIFSTKKPIRVTSAEWSSVNSLRTQRYGNIPEEDIPTIDYFEIGTYNKVNQGYVYFVRNSDKWNFSIVSKRKLRKAERSVDDGESSGSKINGTRTSKGFDKSSDTRSVGNGGAVQPNAFVFENETGSNKRGNFDNWNDTSRGTVRSNRNEADPIDGPAYSLPETQYAIPDIAKGKTNTELLRFLMKYT